MNWISTCYLLSCDMCHVNNTAVPDLLMDCLKFIFVEHFALDYFNVLKLYIYLSSYDRYRYPWVEIKIAVQ